MSLRNMARPFIGLAQRLHRNEGTRRLMIEARDEFDDRVPVLADPPIALHVTSRMEHQRAVGFLTKEPDTIAWLDQLNKDDLFVDIGANIGVYSLYAAIARGARVLAFEPEAQNFAALIRNLADNAGGERVEPWPIALSDSNGPSKLYLSAIRTGGSHHTAGAAIDETGKEFRPSYVQGTVAMMLDDALDALAPGVCPRFIKVDVDGNEEAIVRGMSRTLQDRRVEQVLIEMSAEAAGSPDIRRRLEQAGFVAGRPAWLNKGRGNVIFKRTAGEP